MVVLSIREYFGRDAFWLGEILNSSHLVFCWRDLVAHIGNKVLMSILLFQVYFVLHDFVKEVFWYNVETADAFLIFFWIRQGRENRRD